MRKTSRIFIPVFAGISLTLTSCLHKELCFDHEPHVVRTEVMIEAEYEKEWQYTYEGIDWADYATWNQSFGMTYDSLRPDEPDGLRVQI